MIEISLCMIVKDEEETLARCLESVRDLVDEINIVDTGSGDRTVEIAKQFTDRVYSFEWINDFSAARNDSFSRATKEYLLWLDADDVLLEPDRKAFRELKESLPPEVSMVMMKYNVSFDKAGNPKQFYYRERLMRRDMNYRWIGPVHEAIPPTGNVRRVDIAVTHRKTKVNDPDRNLRIFDQMLANGQPLDRRQLFYYGRELRDHGRYQEASGILRCVIDDEKTWIENRIDACQVLSECLLKLERDRDALLALMESFRFDIPRAEICCKIGRYFVDRKQYQLAAYWYEQAYAQQPNTGRGGFFDADCYGYTPCIQLCFCYDRLGLYEKAREYNEKAAQWKPEDPAVVYNRGYFDRRFAGDGEKTDSSS